MAKSLDNLLGFGWVKWAIGAGAFIAIVVYNWDQNRLTKAENQGVTKVERAATKENQQDAIKLNAQKSANDSVTNWIDRVLPKSTPNNRENRQNSTQVSTNTVANSNVTNLRRNGTNSERSPKELVRDNDLFWRSAAELLSSPDCIEQETINPNTGEIEKGCY